MWELTDEEMDEIDCKYDGLDYELSRKIRQPVYKSIGDRQTANREKAKAQRKKIVDLIEAKTADGWWLKDILTALKESIE